MIKGERETLAGITPEGDLLEVLESCGLANEHLSLRLEAGYTEVSASVGQGRWRGINPFSFIARGWGDNRHQSSSSYPFVVGKYDVRTREERVASLVAFRGVTPERVLAVIVIEDLTAGDFTRSLWFMPVDGSEFEDREVRIPTEQQFSQKKFEAFLREKGVEMGPWCSLESVRSQIPVGQI